jgi:hypothetical protein
MSHIEVGDDGRNIGLWDPAPATGGLSWRNITNSGLASTPSGISTAVGRHEAVLADSDVSTTSHRIPRPSLIFLGGTVGAFLVLMILTALARPAGAVSVPSGSSVGSVPPIAAATARIPAPTVPPVSVPAGAVPGAVPAAAAPTAVNPAASHGMAPLVARTLTAVQEAAAPVTALGSLPAIPLLGAPPINPPAANEKPSVVVRPRPPSESQGRTSSMGTRNRARTAAPGPGRALPSPSPQPHAPKPLPEAPYPSPNSLLAANDANGDAPSGQGGTPFGSLPPPSEYLWVLAVGGVVLIRGRRPPLLLDARYTPPG